MIPPDERTLLLRRLAETAARSPFAPVPDAPAPRRILPDAEQRAALFAKVFTGAGGTFYRGPAESVLHDLAEELRAEGVTVLFFPEGDEEARRVAEALAPFGPFPLSTCALVRGGNPGVAAGFRTAQAGIAETGTVVETGAGGRTLLPGMLADVSVALLPEASLVDSLEDALAALGPDPPRNVTLLSGAERAIVLLF